MRGEKRGKPGPGWTVPELRAECRRRGLPVYQHRGRRLLKADLLKQLQRGARGEGRGARENKARGRPAAAGAGRGGSSNANYVGSGPASREALEGLPELVLREMCLGVDRLADPAASRRAMVALLLATERPLAELERGRQVDHAELAAAAGPARGWVNPGRGLGVVIQ